MNYLEKTAYLRGLADGMKLSDQSSDESRLLLAMIDAMEDLARQVAGNSESIGNLSDEVEELDDVVTGLEEQLDARDGEDEPTEYQLDCPECGQPVVLDEEKLEQGETECPNCGAHLSIDLEA